MQRADGCETLSAMSIFEEPLSTPLAHVLRGMVLDFRVSQPHRVFPTSIYVGDPRGHRVGFTHTTTGSDANGYARATKLRAPPPLDLAQQADVFGVLLDNYVNHAPMREPMVWLTRSGDVDHVHDADLHWLAAATQAFAESRMPLTMVVVTRQGWYDPRSGVSRRWRRLRAR